MEKKLQDLAWQCAPKEFRGIVRNMYERFNKPASSEYFEDARNLLKALYGHHNLTSGTEPACEAFVIPVLQVRETYTYNEQILKYDPTHKGALLLQSYLLQTFGDKCLPDKDIIDEASGIAEESVECLRELIKEEPKPKFSKGDSVLHIPTQIVYDVVEYRADLKSYKLSRMRGVVTCFANESDLEPYTEEPETKRKDAQRLSLSEEELDHIIFELIRIRDNRRENERQLMEILAKIHEQNTK